MIVAPVDPREPRVGPELLALQRAAYAVEAALIAFPAIPPLHESLAELQAAPLVWLGARDDGALVAAVAYRHERDVLDIERLVVAPAHHRRGLARTLLAALPAAARTVVTAARANLPARRCYEQAGFRVVGERAVAPGLVMVAYER